MTNIVLQLKGCSDGDQYPPFTQLSDPPPSLSESDIRVTVPISDGDARQAINQQNVRIVQTIFCSKKDDFRRVNK